MIHRHADILAVQIQSAHPPMHDRGGAWEMALLFVGLALVCCGATRLVRLHRWRIAASATEGRVIDHVPRGRSPRDRGRLAVIEFVADGATWVLPGEQAPPSRGLPIGRTVGVLYDRSDPRRAGLADRWMSLPWPLVVGLAAVGAFLVIINI